jgi:hypothetical protein
MAASLYIVVEGEDPGFDIYVNGRALARNEGELEKLAMRVGVKPLLDYFSADRDAMALLVEEGAGNEKLLERLPQAQWYAPEDGLVTVRALLEALRASAELLGEDTRRVAAELEEYERVLMKTAAHKLRWHLAVSWR